MIVNREISDFVREREILKDEVAKANNKFAEDMLECIGDDIIKTLTEKKETKPLYIESPNVESKKNKFMRKINRLCGRY